MPWLRVAHSSLPSRRGAIRCIDGAGPFGLVSVGLVPGRPSGPGHTDSRARSAARRTLNGGVMPIDTVLPLVIGISLLSLAVAWVLARQVLAADTGTPEMRQISDAIREGAEAFLSRQYRTIGMLSIVAAAAIFGFYFFNRDVKNIEEMGVGTFWKVTISFLIGRPVLRDRRLHRHVRLDPREHPHRHRRDDEPQQGPPARAARRRRLRPRRGLHEPARRGRALLALRRHARLPSTCRSRSSASASARASWPSSPSSAAGSTRRPPTSAPTSWARSRRASPRTTRATPRSSPTSWATTSATAPAAAPTSSSRRRPRTSAP